MYTKDNMHLRGVIGGHQMREAIISRLVADSNKEALVDCAFLKLLYDFQAEYNSLWCGPLAHRVDAALHVGCRAIWSIWADLWRFQVAACFRFDIRPCI